ncbi:MAG: NAD(P)/FAD-dependent oxidoreductase [Solirubrobacteraceae bacterium]
MSSFWMQDVAADRIARPALTADRTADVCIIGGGYTGLWTAYELLRAQPDLDVVVLEAEEIGFGASGRNGGWVIGVLAGDRETWSRRGGREAVIAQDAAIRATVPHIGEVVGEERIDCDFVHGGTLRVAEDGLQRARLEAEIAAERAWATGPSDFVLLERDELRQRVNIPSAVAGLFSPHCARIHPAKLALGLAAAAQRRGATILEHSRVTQIAPGRVSTAAATVRARHVIRATEGYTARLPGLRRALLPMRSSMIVTAPLSDATWSAIGWDGAETLHDSRYQFIYAQRTRDGRIAIGGRGKPYRYASGCRAEGFADASVARELRARLVALFPMLADVAIETSWQGVLGVSRDWTPAVSLDPVTGLGWAGGYVGDGVAASNLAARTLRDLVLGRRSALTALPWVAPLGRHWEPEPLRWLGVHGVYQLLRRADAQEQRTGRPSPFAVPARMLGAAR